MLISDKEKIKILLIWKNAKTVTSVRPPKMKRDAGVK